MKLTDVDIEKVVYKSPQNGWCVLRGKHGNKKYTLVGQVADVYEGMAMDVEGEWIKDSKYGKQFKILKSRVKLKADQNGIISFLSSNFCKGIGPKTAGLIYEKFGEETFNIIENEPDKLLVVKGVNAEKLDNLVMAMKNSSLHRELFTLLSESGITQVMCTKIAETLGSDAVDQIFKDPYILFRKIKNVGFLKADHFALNNKTLNIKLDSPLRLTACIEYSLKTLSTHTGHCYLTYDQLIPEVLKLLGGVSKDKVLEHINHMIKDPSNFLRVRFIADEPVFYFKTIYELEIKMAELLNTLNNRKLTYNYASELNQVIEKLKNDGFELSREQKEAIDVNLHNGFSVLTGGPGTGKTTVTKVLVETFKKANKSILLCAPTGKAAKRAGDVTGITGYTIHRGLGWQKGKFTFDKKTRLYQDVIIIDECSMKNISLFYAILSAAKKDAHIILIGDIDQLPPVGIGDVFRNIIDDPYIPTVRLTKIFRQAQESGIIRFAHGLMREGKILINDTDCKFYKSDTVESDLDRVVEIYKESDPEEFQVIIPIKGGELGVDNVNLYLQEKINPPEKSKAEVKLGHITFREGDRVIQTKNNYEHEVFNGDLGWIRKIESDLIHIEYDGTLYEFKKEDLNQVALAYAITIHKTQGSEFKKVLILMYKAAYVMLSRSLLYTAATRAKEDLIILGQYPALKICADNSNVAKRQTYLPQLIRRGEEEDQSKRDVI